MAKQRRRIGEILTEWGVITQAGIVEALEHAKKEHLRIGEALVALGLVDEEDLTKALATQYDMEYIDLDQSVGISSEMHLIPEDIIRRHLVLPMGKDDNGRLKVAITDPLDLETLDLLKFRLNCDLETCLASRTKMRNYIDQFVRSDVSIDEAVQQIERDADRRAGPGDGGGGVGGAGEVVCGNADDKAGHH